MLVKNVWRTVPLPSFRLIFPPNFPFLRYGLSFFAKPVFPKKLHYRLVKSRKKTTQEPDFSPLFKISNKRWKKALWNSNQARREGERKLIGRKKGSLRSSGWERFVPHLIEEDLPLSRKERLFKNDHVRILFESGVGKGRRRGLKVQFLASSFIMALFSARKSRQRLIPIRSVRGPLPLA